MFFEKDHKTYQLMFKKKLYFNSNSVVFAVTLNKL